MEKQVRNSKVSSRNQQRTYSYKQVPEVRLAGLWLSKAGFNSGDALEVEVQKGTLVIKVKQ